jgi:Na+/proline symporter
MLAPASIIGNNMVPMIFRGMSDRAKLWTCKLAVPVVGVLAMVTAMRFKSIYELCLEAWSVLLTSITAPLLFGVFWRRTSAVGATAGAVLGTVAWIVLAVRIEDETHPVKLWALLISAAATFAGSLLWPRRSLPTADPSMPAL